MFIPTYNGQIWTRFVVSGFLTHTMASKFFFETSHKSYDFKVCENDLQNIENQILFKIF